MTTTITDKKSAQKRLKQIDRTVAVYERAVGIMEVDGWFGKGEPVKGLSECSVKMFDGLGEGYYEDTLTCEGGAVCTGMAIWGAARDQARALRWNTEKVQSYINRHLDLFSEINGLEVRPSSTFRGIASWNDYEVTYPEVKEAFGVVLKKLAAEKWELITRFKLQRTSIDTI